MYRSPQQSYLPPVRHPYAQPAKPLATKPQSNTMMIVFVVGLLVLIGGAVAYYFLSKKDESQGTNIIPNGDFSQGSTGWTSTGTWAISGGKATCNGTGVLTVTPKLSQYAGKTVKVYFDIVERTSGAIFVGSGQNIGSGKNTVYHSNIGTANATITIDTTYPEFGFNTNPNFVGSIDNVKAFVVS